MREACTAHEVFKAWVRTERIEAWSDQDAGVKPLFVAYFEPTHGLICLPQRCIDYGNLRSIATGQDLERFFKSPSNVTASLLLPDAA